MNNAEPDGSFMYAEIARLTKRCEKLQAVVSAIYPSQISNIYGKYWIRCAANIIDLLRALEEK